MAKQRFVDRRPLAFSKIIVDYHNKRVSFADREKGKFDPFSFLAALYFQYVSVLIIPLIMLGVVFAKLEWNGSILFMIPVLFMILHLNNWTGPAVAQIYPKMMGGIYKYIGSYKKRVFTNITAKRIEIPSFGNTFLEYKAVKDYQKYLTRVEVKEKKIATKVSRWRKKEYPLLEWTAYFHFSKVPKEGELRCFWR